MPLHIPLRVLIVEDRPADAELMLYELERSGYRLMSQRVETEADYLSQLKTAPDIILADHSLPDFGAPRAIELLKSTGLDIPLIVVTGSISEEVAVARLKQGAADYILKDRMARLGDAVARALNEKRLRDEKRGAEEALRVSLDESRISEAKFRGLLESAPDPIVAVGQDGRVVLVNTQTEKVFGYSRGELLGQPIEMLVPERFHGSHARLRADYQSHPVTRPMGFGQDLYGRCKDGREIPVAISLSPLKTEESLVIAIVRDISDRKQAEESLKNRYQELQTLQGVSQIILAAPDIRSAMEKILDSAMATGPYDIGTIRLFDPATAMLTPVSWRGYRDPANIERHHQRTIDTMTGTMTARIMTFEEPRIEEDVAHSEGLRTWKREGVQSAIVIPVRVQDSLLGVFQLGARAARKFTPDEIRLLKAVSDQVGVAIQKARAQEETERNLRRINALHEIDLAITSTLDLRATLDVLLQKINFFLPDYSATTVRLFNEDSGLLEPIVCRGLDETEWKAEQWRAGRGIPNAVFVTKTSRMVPNVQTDPDVKDPEFFRKHGLISYLGVPLIAKDQALGVLSFYTKREHRFSAKEIEFLNTLAGQAAIAISNARLFEQTRKQAVDLERSNRVKDEFLSVMSHELRTPLSVVMGYTGMVKERMLGEINPKQEEALQKVLNRAADQLQMINEIMQTTQLEARALIVEREMVNLSDLLRSLRSDYELAHDKKEVAVVWDDPAQPITMLTDIGKLKQILQSLINNAIKFTDRGSVTVSARVVEGKFSVLSSQFLVEKPEAATAGGAGDGQEAETQNSKLKIKNSQAGRWVELAVKDTGVGIPKDKLQAIFDKFYQVDSSETRLYGGVGLGLFIVKKFTELLGGQVEVESEVGKGSMFTVTIPSELQ